MQIVYQNAIQSKLLVSHVNQQCLFLQYPLTLSSGKVKKHSDESKSYEGWNYPEVFPKKHLALKCMKNKQLQGKKGL